VFLLWPGAGAVELGIACASLKPAERYTLLVLDGTWTQTREMVGPLLLRLRATRAVLVKLACENDASLMLRTEPQLGCVVTAEAVARALFELEARATGLAAARALQDSLLAPLRLLVAKQRSRDTLGKGINSRRLIKEI